MCERKTLSIPCICECGFSTMDAKIAYRHAMQHQLAEEHRPDCPFSGIPIACDKPDCRGCLVRIEAQTKEAEGLLAAWREDQRIAENMRDYWRCQKSGAA